jgi:hypothetical protein
VLVARSVSAQSTIFNIPSTDTVDKGKGYFEFDVLPQAPGPDGGGGSIVIYNPRGIVGLPHDTEIGVNIPIYHVPGGATSNFTYIQPNIKTKVYKNDDAGVAVALGVVANFAMNATDSQLPWAYVYGNVSKKVKAAHDARFTIGPYGVIAKQDDPVKVGFVGTRGGVLLGYEQPLGGPVSFVADWFSGKNSIGYFTPGVSIALPHSGLLNIGYSFGNDSWENSNATKNRYVFVYYGVTF